MDWSEMTVRDLIIIALLIFAGAAAAHMFL